MQHFFWVLSQDPRHEPPPKSLDFELRSFNLLASLRKPSNYLGIIYEAGWCLPVTRILSPSRHSTRVGGVRRRRRTVSRSPCFDMTFEPNLVQLGQDM